MVYWMWKVNMTTTVYPKKYAHGFCFAVLCCGYTLTDFPISIRLTSLALWQSNDCPSASKATLMNMDKYFMWIRYDLLHNHNKAKHNKTVCIFLGIYCMFRQSPQCRPIITRPIHYKILKGVFCEYVSMIFAVAALYEIACSEWDLIVQCRGIVALFAYIAQPLWHMFDLLFNPLLVPMVLAIIRQPWYCLWKINGPLSSGGGASSTCALILLRNNIKSKSSLCFMK